MEENSKKSESDNKKTIQAILESIWSYIKSFVKQFKIMVIFSVAGVIFGAIQAYYSIIDHNPKEPIRNETELLRQEINERIKFIEDNFHPEKIPNDLDTIKYYDIFQIKEFQRISLEIAAVWRDVDNIPNSYDLDVRTSKALEDVMQNFSNKLMLMIGLKYIDLLGTMTKLNAYGDSTMQSYYLIDTAKYLKTLESSKEDPQLEKEYNEAHDKFVEMLEKYKSIIKDSDDIPEDLFEAERKYFSLEEKKYHSKVTYNSDLLFFDFIIQQNNQYSIPLKRFFLSN